MPHLSVVVPTHNNEHTLPQCLEAIRSSSFKDYELIVVDGASTDQTQSIAKKHTDIIVSLKMNNRGLARNAGMKLASGSILLNIDSDVVVMPDTLKTIVDYFTLHADVDAVTGLLSKTHPNTDFFSQYKNLYMHYVFQNLSEQVSFLYGSIHAFRKEAFQCYSETIMTDDTELGQRLTKSGKKISLIKKLEVIHLKPYTAWKLLENDFLIPFGWAHIFWRYNGILEIKNRRGRFAHASKIQIASIIGACFTAVLAMLSFTNISLGVILAASAVIWILLNTNFFLFLKQEKGVFFFILAIPTTFIDNIVMALGIFFGSLTYWIKKNH